MCRYGSFVGPNFSTNLSFSSEKLSAKDIEVKTLSVVTLDLLMLFGTKMMCDLSYEPLLCVST